MTKSESALKARHRPDFSIEAGLHRQGLSRVAGVDEAGRGPLAGPVVAAAVILDPAHIPDGLNDSKKLDARRRDLLFTRIVATAEVAAASAPPEVIAALNIRGATLWAMRRAVLGLATRPVHALIDGRDVPEGLPCPGQAVIGGDGRSLSIAAASIVAKVMRDLMCPVMERDAPGYGLDGHKGYGTKAHLIALDRLGPGPHHRMEFGPVARAAKRDAPA